MKTRVSASVLAVLLLALCHSAAAFELFSFLRNAVLAPTEPPSAQGRIIGGTKVRDQCKAPFNSVAHIKIKGSNGIFQTACTGTLLTPSIVVTAASCLSSSRTSVANLYVALGDRDAELVDVGGPNRFQEQTIQIDTLKFHSGYNVSKTEDDANNIVLIKLKTLAVLDQYCVQTMTRYDSATAAAAMQCPQPTANCTILGWGSTSDLSSEQFYASTVLNYGFVKVILNKDVAAMVMRNDYPSESSLKEGIDMIGSAFAGSYVGTCKFDHGSMLACPGANGTLELRGILSNHNKCNRSITFSPIPNRPMYFTGIENYKAWIDSCLANFADIATCPGHVYM